jgi:uncharacterized protein
MVEADSLFARLAENAAGRLPPVSVWQPTRTGVSQMRIARDGRWYYQGSEIRRPEMVRLFATILRRDPDGIYLVTPAEKLSVDVDDAPFLAVDMESRGNGRNRALVFLTNVGDVVSADAAHPITLQATAAGMQPYVEVRASLKALIARSVYYRLAELAERDERDRWGVWSGGEFFTLQPD